MGTASFLPTKTQNHGLLYKEQGTLYSIEQSMNPIQTHRHYFFDFSSSPIRVFFVNNPEPLQLGDLFHTLEFDSTTQQEPTCGTAQFEHLCINDLYKGNFQILNKDKFCWNWFITGPNKDGNIQSVYQRNIFTPEKAGL